MNPLETYDYLMKTIRNRFDVIEVLRQSSAGQFSRGESAAFHGRKIVEAIAFGCLVAIDQGVKAVPKDAKGKWNAEKILKSLDNKHPTALPSPSIIRNATSEEINEYGITVAIEGVPERRLSHRELISIYQRLHSWLHEINPYTNRKHSEFYAIHSETLWRDLMKLHVFMERHFISIQGEGFFCVLRDSGDDQTKVISLSKPDVEPISERL